MGSARSGPASSRFVPPWFVDPRLGEDNRFAWNGGSQQQGSAKAHAGSANRGFGLCRPSTNLVFPSSSSSNQVVPGHSQGIDFKRREAYLSAEEFEAVLGMTKDAFYKIPKWKQDMMKKKVDLF
ncbi:hypothetical protein R6Q59_013521 [Mikania micrantha]